MIPSDLRYTKEHEWVRVAGDEATIGITQHAADQLGDIVFVELPPKGRKVKQGESFGTIEAVKAVSDLCADTGPVVSVYPHRGNWTERVEDGGAGDIHV